MLQPVIYQKKELSYEEQVKINSEIIQKPELKELYLKYLPLIFKKTLIIHRSNLNIIWIFKVF